MLGFASLVLLLAAAVAAITVRDLLDYVPLVVTALQSAIVKWGSVVFPRFAALKTWAKLSILFGLGLLFYLLLGLAFGKALLAAVISTATGALIYYFGRKPNAVPKARAGPR